MNRMLYVGRFFLFALLLVAAWMPAALRSVPRAAGAPAAAVEMPDAPVVPAAEPERPVAPERELGAA